MPTASVWRVFVGQERDKRSRQQQESYLILTPGRGPHSGIPPDSPQTNLWVGGRLEIEKFRQADVYRVDKLFDDPAVSPSALLFG